MPSPLSGLSVLIPSAGWALLTLLIPILIHLFNRSRGRLVHIGHIDLVRQAQKLRVTEVKLAQLLLLSLRLAIFTVAVLILAGLARPGLVSSTEATVYVTPGWLATSETEDFKKLLKDAEKEPGTRVFVLQQDFPRLDQQWFENFRKTSPLSAEDIRNVWPLLAERLSIERHGGAVKVYATDYTLQYGSRKPELPRQVSWYLSHPQSPPVLDTTPIHAMIAHDPDRASEATLLSSVLAILKEHRLPGLSWEVSDASQMSERHLNADWLILLSDTGISAAQLAMMPASAVVLMDAGDGSVASSEQFVDLPFYPFSTFRLNRYTITGRHEKAKDPDFDWQVMLTTAEGQPLFEQSRYGSIRQLRYNSRFAPGWSTITQQVEFPELFMSLMLNDSMQALRFANARVNPSQLQSGTGKTGSDIPLPRRSLQGLLALFLVLLWVTERWLSERKSREAP